MKSCYSEHFGTHYDLALDAGIFYRGYKKVCLIPVLPTQLFGYLRNFKKVKFRYSKIQFSTLSYFDLLNFFLKWQLNTLFFLMSKIKFLFFKKPIDLIKNIYIEDQFISFCLRHPIQLFSKRNSYRYNPNLLTYFWAIYNFIGCLFSVEFYYSFGKLYNSCFIIYSNKYFFLFYSTR